MKKASHGPYGTNCAEKKNRFGSDFAKKKTSKEALNWPATSGPSVSLRFRNAFNSYLKVAFEDGNRERETSLFNLHRVRRQTPSSGEAALREFTRLRFPAPPISADPLGKRFSQSVFLSPYTFVLYRSPSRSRLRNSFRNKASRQESRLRGKKRIEMEPEAGGKRQEKGSRVFGLKSRKENRLEVAKPFRAMTTTVCFLLLS